jgi:hypothetical protein
MAKKLLVETKDGVTREMTKTQYDLIGFKRKPKIIGEVKPEHTVSEMDKLKADLIAKKAAGLPLNDEPKEEVSQEQVIEQPKKKSPGRPKSTPTE